MAVGDEKKIAMTPERGLIQCALFTPMSPGVLIEKTAASFKV
jgi:hypothetical protein